MKLSGTNWTKLWVFKLASCQMAASCQVLLCLDDKWSSSDSLNADTWKRFHVSRQRYWRLLPEKKVMEICFALQFLEIVIFLIRLQTFSWKVSLAWWKSRACYKSAGGTTMFSEVVWRAICDLKPNFLWHTVDWIVCIMWLQIYWSCYSMAVYHYISCRIRCFSLAFVYNCLKILWDMPYLKWTRSVQLCLGRW